MRGSKLLTRDLSRGVGRHYATNSPRCWSTHTRVLLPGHPVSPKSTTWLATKASYLGTCQALLVTLMPPLLISFSTKEGGLHVPRTKCLHHSTPSRRVDDDCRWATYGPKASGEPCTPWFTQESPHKVGTTIHSLSSKPSLALSTYTKHMQAYGWAIKHLDGLDMIF
jgi:hypothetical protein